MKPKRGWAPGRHRFKGEGRGAIASLAIAIYACEGCGLWAGAAKPAQCMGCGRMDFVRFDSKAEAKRWAQLELMQASGLISDLRRQVRFGLHAASMIVDRPAVVAQKIGDYIADFTYQEDGKTVIEDAKGGAITDLASWKLRHMHAQYGVEVKLVTE